MHQKPRTEVRSRRLPLAWIVLCFMIIAGCEPQGGGARLSAVGLVPPTGFAWSGALTARSVDIVAGLQTADSTRLVIRPEADSLPAFASPAFVPAGDVIRTQLRGLTPNVRYAYAFEARGESLLEGSFRTPGEGPFSFSLAAGACALTGSDRPVFDAIRAADPLFFVHMGDMFYEDIEETSTGFYRRAYSRIFRSSSQSALYRHAPLVYVWDDHDYGPNDSDRTAIGNQAVREVYEALAPHYPLADGPIYQAFTVGRVRFIVTDLRSARDPVVDALSTEDPGGIRSMMGAEQKAWFKRQMLDANGRFPMIVWVSTVPWIGQASLGADHWGGFARERREIADFVKANDIRGLTILSGDAHMIAIDDGTNSDYATGGGAPIPVVHAAPMDQVGTVKGGPYSEGTFPGPSLLPPHPGQWVEMSVEDTGGAEVCATWTGFRTDSRSTDTEALISWSRCFPAQAAAEVDGDLIPAPSAADLPTIAIERIE